LIARISKFFAAFLSFLHNYLDDPTKLFSDLCLTKFLDILAKSFCFLKYDIIKLED